MAETLTASIIKIRFQRGDFAILVVMPKGEARTLVTKGNILPSDLEKFTTSQQIQVVFHGEYEDHAKWGRQFNFKHYYEYHPEDAREISPATLASFIAGEILGIGPVKATKMITECGGTEQLVGWLEDGEANNIAAASDIEPQKALMLVDAWGKKKAKMKVVSFFAEFGVKGIFPHKIFEEFGESTIPTIENNPYILIKFIDGIGFKRADDIAVKMGIVHTAPVRIKAAIMFCLETKCWNAGNCFLHRDDLILECKRVAKIPSSMVDEQLDELFAAADGNILSEYDERTGDQRIYLPVFLAAEKGVAERVKEMLA